MWLRPPARPVKPLHKHSKVVLPSSRFLIYFVIAGLWAFLWVLFAVFVHFPCVIVQITLVSVACVLSATAVISLVCIPAVFLPAFQGSSRLFLCVASGLICGLVLCCLPTPQPLNGILLEERFGFWTTFGSSSFMTHFSEDFLSIHINTSSCEQIKK